MPKNKDRSAEEWYRGRIRELEKEIKKLNRRIRELEKYDRDNTMTSEMLRESEMKLRKLSEHASTQYKDLCVKCFKGRLELKISVRGKDYFTCNTCDYKMNKPSKEDHGDS